MGLDAYLYSVPLSEEEDAPAYSRDLEKDCNVKPTLIHYWRKHHPLHEYMEAHWEKDEEDPEDNVFNCVALKLTRSFVERLREYILAGGLDGAYGEETAEERDETRQDLLVAFEKAEIEMDLGHTVYYNSWW